jgi:hypothetical protein
MSDHLHNRGIGRSEQVWASWLLPVVVCTLVWLGLQQPTLGQLPPVPEEGAEQSKPQPRLHVEELKKELGDVLEGDTVPVTWTLENRGDADLIITRTQATCGCTVVELKEDQKTIPPGGTLELGATFNSTSRRGKQHKSVYVMSNDPTQPKLKLSFEAEVALLFEMRPRGALALRQVRRGQTADRHIDVVLAEGREKLSIDAVEIEDHLPLRHYIEPLESRLGEGQRISFVVDDYAAMGRLSGKITVKLTVDGIHREVTLVMNGLVVGDLNIQPALVDQTRQKLLRGQRLAPVTLRSTDSHPFEILRADAGPYLDLTIDPDTPGVPKTEYRLRTTIREDAPTGPFAAELVVYTSSVDQPVMTVPIFGVVRPVVEVEPAMVLLKQDSSPIGRKRIVKLSGITTRPLEITKAYCDNPAVKVMVDGEASRGRQHLAFLVVELAGDLSSGRTEATLRLETSTPGAEHLEIPVNIVVP